MNDIYYYLADLPHGVRGVAIPNDDATYTVYVSSRLSDEERQRTCLHERRHIENDDFYTDEPVAAQEKRAEGE